MLRMNEETRKRIEAREAVEAMNELMGHDECETTGRGSTVQILSALMLLGGILLKKF